MKNINIRLAGKDEYEKVKQFYDDLIDHMDMFDYGPQWEKGIYPAYDYLYSSIEKNELYIGQMNEEIVSAMIVNKECNVSYLEASWQTHLKSGEYLIIHALGVSPYHTKQGIGRQMVEYVIKHANTFKAIRLDVLKGNLSANKLYESVGFKLNDTIQMYYEDTGWTDFELYEYVL